MQKIVLKLSGNPRSFVLVGLHQTLAQTRESEPCKLQIRDVNRRADVAFKAAILEKPRRAGVEDPSILAVVPAEPILHPEGFTPIERVAIGLETARQIPGMHGVRPASSEDRSDRLADEIEPRAIDVGTALVRTGDPHHHRRRARQQTKTPFALTLRAGRTSSCKARNERNHEHHLDAGDRHDRALVLLPQCRLAKHDLAPRRQALLVDVPAAQFAPVEDGGSK